MKYELRNIEETARQLESRNRHFETTIQEKDIRNSRSEADSRHLQEKLDNMENIHRKELEAQKDRVSIFKKVKVGIGSTN